MFLYLRYGEKDVSHLERIYIGYRQRGWEKVKQGRCTLGAAESQGRSVGLWIPCGQRIGKSK